MSLIDISFGNYNLVIGRWFICNDNTVNNADWSIIATLNDIDLSAIEASIASLSSQVSTHTTNISNLTTSVTTNTTLIGGLTTTTNTHTTQIAALQASIDALQTRAYGGMYITATAQTSGASSYVKAAGTTTADSLLSQFTHTTNRLTYTGASTKRFRVQVDGKVSGGLIATVSLAVYKIITSPASQTLIRSEDTATVIAVSEGSYGVNCIVELAQNQAVEIWIRTTNGLGTVTLRTATFTITEV